MNSSFREEAKQLDRADQLAHWRSEFLFPETPGAHCIYFTGNSLGLQPRRTRQFISEELEDWARFGVEGHFHGRRPWYSYHEQLMDTGARQVGARYGEVVHMNGLSVNLHLLMVSFYRPTRQRFKIITEAKAFPSDQYVVESQLKFHGYRLEDAWIEVGPRPGEHLIREEDILKAIAEVGDELALVFWGGVNYYSGQYFDMEAITRAAHQVGAVAGFDLAHAAGNVPLDLHNWNVDFAAWCTYKYYNSGPGSVSGIFIHEKHGQNSQLPRFAGWWGHDKEVRFKMEPGFKPVSGAEGWQISNAPVFVMAPHLASLQIFEEAGLKNLREKSVRLTAFLEKIILHTAQSTSAEMEIISPSDPGKRGCQLSILVHGYGKTLFDELQTQGVVADWREPNVIRIAPVPLYNSFMDCCIFGEVLGDALLKLKKS